MLCYLSAEPGCSDATARRFSPRSPGCWVLSLCLAGSCAFPVSLLGQSPLLFPPLALGAQSSDLYSQHEPADEYTGGSGTPATGYGTDAPAGSGVQPLDLGQRAGFLNLQDRAGIHPYSNSHNLEWIENHSRLGGRSSNHYSYGAFPETVPSYQVYGRQQHHGRFESFGGGFGNHSALASPTGFGHGGLQAGFARSVLSTYRDPSHPPNFELGPLSANFSAYNSTEWIDRLPSTILQNGSPGADDSLLIISAGIDTAAQLQISDRGTLEFQIGAGFDYYPDGRPGNEGREDSHIDFQVLPNTYTSYTFEIAQTEFSLYDRFARFRNRSFSYYSLDPLDYADYQQHALGMTARRPLNDRVTADVGFEFDKLDSLGQGGELLDRVTHNVFGGVTYSPDGAWEIGTQASASVIDYDQEARPDGSSATAGVFGNLPLSKYTRLSATAGVHRFEFDQVAGFADSDSLNSTYWSASIENDLNDRLTHSLVVGSGAAVGVSSNYVETAHAGYTAQWRVFDDTVVSAGVNLQRSAESGGILPEEIDGTYYRIGVRHELTEHTSLGVDLSKSVSRSDLGERDYDQQRLQLFCAIELNDRLELRASYQNWDVGSQSDLSSFTQNSATIGFTLSF